MAHRFYTADVFTDRPFGGNPLAVFPDAGGLDGAAMQRIARELNLSETTFVLPREDGAGPRVRIFTPAAELPFAGHPTIGTAFVLASIGVFPAADETSEVVLEEGVGPVPVEIHWKGGEPTFCRLTAARAPETGPAPPAREDLERLLDLSPDSVGVEDLEPAYYSCGIPFLFVPVRDADALGRATLQGQPWRRLLGGAWSQEVFVFTPGGRGGDVDFRARMFAPRLGVPEDPATGSAAAALAGYLGDRVVSADGAHQWVVEQGVEMGRPSTLHVEAQVEGGRVVASRVGGGTVLVSEGRFLVP